MYTTRGIAPGLTLSAFLTLAAIILVGCASSDQTRSTTEELRDLDTITQEVIEQTPNAVRVEQLIQGRVAGVHVTETAGGFRIRIRGQNSFLGSNDPLYVIDGIPMNPGPNGLIGINPRDVESIRVLKNAGDTAMYGVRGANGVIVITTKRGGR